MIINVAIDEKLIEEARKIVGSMPDKDVVEGILSRFIEGRHKHKDLLDLVGKIEFYEGYDPKSLR